MINCKQLSVGSFLLLLFSFAIVVTPVSGQAVISYGVVDGGIRYIDLQPNTANQAVGFFVTGLAGLGGADGLELDLQIGDGGVALGGVDTKPVLGAIDMITGTIFVGAGPSQNNVVNSPLAKQSTVDTTSLVSANGLIATVMFDTTGFNSGEINFLLSGVAGTFNTKFFQGVNPLGTTAPNGRLRITAVPEPSSVLLLTGMLGLGLRRRRSQA